MSWQDVTRIFRDRQEDRKIYFSEQKDQILTSNLLLYQRLSIFCVAAIILYTLIIGIFLQQWHISVFHIVLMVFMCVHIALSVYINKHRLKSKTLEKFACVVFNLCLFLTLICVDTIATPNNSQVFCSAFLVIAPAMFIMPPSRMLIDELFFVVVYAGFAFTFKDLAHATQDMYAIWAGFFFGIVLYLITLDLRLKSNSEVIRLKHFSEIDELTKIKNRRAANAQISYILTQRDPKSACALMMLDVDNFKTINDTCGHSTGDQVLIDVAKILTSAFRKSDVVSRFGGDEFLVFVSGFDDDDFLRKKCAEIEDQVQGLSKDKLAVSCSMGMCILKEGYRNMDVLVHEADAALYQTKERQKGTYTIRIITQT